MRSTTPDMTNPWHGRLATVSEVLGVAAVAYGLWLIYPPAMWIWIGVAAFGVSYALEVGRRLTAAGHEAQNRGQEAGPTGV